MRRVSTGPAGAGPHPMDRHVGLRIRQRRKALGVTQEGLAETLQVTFQQVQKYERGVNRVSASKLWSICQALKAPPAYFFDGFDPDGADPAATSGPTALHKRLLRAPEGAELVRTLPTLDAQCRRKLIELIRALVEPGEVEG